MIFVRIILKWLWLGLVIALLAIAGVLGWFNSFLYTPASLEAIRVYLSEKTALPWVLGRAGGNILEGLRLHEAAIDNPGAPDPGILFRWPILLFKFELWTMPFGRLDLLEVKINNPEMRLQVGADQRVLWPKSDQASVTSSTVPANPQFLAWLRGANWSCQKIRLENGQISMQGPGGKESFRLSGLGGNFLLQSRSNELLAGGQASASELQVGEAVVTDCQSVLSYDQGLLRFPDFLGHAYHGTLLGSYEQKLIDGQQPFAWKVSPNKLEVNELFAALFHEKEAITGQLSGATTWRGNFTNRQDLTGNGTLTVENGQLIRVGFLADLSAHLGVKDLSQPDYSKCRIDFSFEKEVFTLSSLVLNSILFDFTATGSIRLDGGWDLAAQLLAKPDLVKQLSPIVLGLFPPDKDGQMLLKFHLKGDFDQTETDLWSQLTPPSPPTQPIPAEGSANPPAALPASNPNMGTAH